MIAAVIVAAVVTIYTMARRAGDFRRRAAFHAAEELQLRHSLDVENEYLVSLNQDIEHDLNLAFEQPGTDRESYYLGSAKRRTQEVEELRSNMRAALKQIDHHADLKWKYEQAASRPYLLVEPDPPEPPWPDQGPMPVFGPTAPFR
jgi:hypothetical protein